MDFRRFLRGPAFFVVVGLLLLLLATQIFSSGGFQRIDTADGLKLLEEGKVEQAKIVDREQRVDLTLADDFGDKGTKVQFFYVQPRGLEVVDAVSEADLAKPFNDEVPKDSWWATLAVTLLPILLLVGLFWFMLSQMQGGGSRVLNFGKSKAKLVSKDTPQVTFADVAGADEAVEELLEIKEFLAEPAKFQAVGRQDPQGRAALRLARYRQDPARPGGRRRGGRAVLHDLRVGLRRDVRRRRRVPRPRPVRAGQGQRAGDHLRRRDRRRRPPPRCGHGRRARRARADPQPAAGRDGRLRRQDQRHPDRGDQPSRHPRPRAAAPGSLRPADRGRPARHGRPAPDPQGPRRGQAARGRRRPGGRGPSHTGVHRRRPRQRPQRGCPAHGAHQRQADRQRRARRGDRPGDRRPAEAHPADERPGEEDHRLPRGRPRPGRGGDAAHRPGHEGDDPAPRAGARLHDGDAARRTSTRPRATSCSTSSPTRWAAAWPRSSSSTTPPPAPRTTSRRPPPPRARWSPSSA